MSEEQISSVLKSVIEEEGVENAKVTTRKSTQKGEGYGSERTFVDVKGDNKTLNLLFKCEPQVPEHLVSIIAKAFDIEINFYNKLVPALDDFSGGKELPIARCYKTLLDDDCKMLVLDNLAPHGYGLRDCKVCMNREELSLVMRQYGKLHATSMTLRHRDPERFAELTRGMIAPFNELLLDLYREQLMVRVDEAIDIYCKEKVGADYEKLARYKENLIEFLNLAGETSENCAILHGDCWNNNLLFKYDPENTDIPTDLKIVDFQLNRVGSPALDLSYIFYYSAGRGELERLESHLQTYHESFASRTRELGGDPDVVYPYEEFRKDWRTYCKFGYTMAVLFFNVSYRADDEIKELNHIPDGGGFTDFLETKTRNADLVRERLFDLTEHMIANDFL